MNDSNGVQFDLSDDQSFKLFVVQKLQKLCDVTESLPDLIEKVESHERLVVFGKWLGVPVFLGAHISLKAFLAKLGWH